MEILVHIAAPSKTSDDARYRALASAYINFQPYKRIEPSEPLGADKGNSNASLDDGRDEDGYVVPRRNSQQIARSGESFPSLNSPQASFRSVQHNANSPLHMGRVRYETPRAYPLTQDATSQSSWQTPPSIVQDSVPENEATTAVFTTPTRVLEHYLQQFNSHASPQTSISPLRDSPQNVAVESQKSTSILSSSDQTSGSRGLITIPCTPGSSPLPVSSVEPGTTAAQHQLGSYSHGHQHGSQDYVTDDEVIEDTIMYEPETPPVARADSEPPPSNRQRKDNIYNSPQALLRTASDIGPQRSMQTAGRAIPFLPQHGYNYNSLQLQAPDPMVGNAHITPEDLITLGLEKLASDLQIPKRFRPDKKTRDLQPFERGYWALDCSGWSQELKGETWVFLANYIGTGVAGWGVSCKRDEAFSWLRVYCWGAVVAHIYLLLYLASQRKILFTGAVWIDGEGVAVFVMGKRA